MAALALCSAGLFLGTQEVASGAEPASPATPRGERQSFALADASLEIDLVASEPEVVSPVAIAWDADGRLFVAEMTDYPTGPRSGRVRLLKDSDGDGRYETATVFAGSLSFPNSVLPWNGGVLVTAAPEILFLKDVDGDGKTDERRVLFTGFAEGNQQLRANGLTWGLDNWIYGANGRSDGEVRPAGDTNAKPVSLRGHDFRFRPETLAFEPVAGRSQFGLGRDDWGNRFLSWNTIPIRHEVIPERYLVRNPLLPATESLQDLLAPGDTGRVFPISPAPQTFNSESVTHFNALAGLTVYRGDALGEDYRGNAFVGESLRNLVHRRVLEPDGVTFVARRGEEGREFLASTDPWFHPVNFATGPDGALYIVDFYRKWVEHPGFVHTKARDQIDWREGVQHGRIWRVTRKSTNGTARPATPTLSTAPVAELVKHLESGNAWWRDAAQRLLVERQNRAAVPLLAQLARKSKQPVARLQALFTLEGLNAIDDRFLTVALRDPHPRVRQGALRLAEARLETVPQVKEAVLAMVDDPDPRVRLQLALSLGASDDDFELPALARLAGSAPSDRWLATAVLSSVGRRALPLLQRLRESDTRWRTAPDEASAGFLERVAGLIGAANQPQDARPFLALLTSDSTGGSAKMALLAGYAQGIKRAQQSLHGLLKQAEVGESGIARSIEKVFLLAAATASNSGATTPQRLKAIRVLANAERAVGGPVLIEKLRAPAPDAIQTAAARAFAESADAGLARNVFESWDEFGPAARRKIIAASLNSPLTLGALVMALEQGRVTTGELDAPTRDALRKTRSPAVKQRLEKLLQEHASEEREQVVQRFAVALKLEGDRRHGAELFARNCLVCHAMQERGQRVGPDLSGVNSRPAERLLTDILDPSRELSPDFISYDLTTIEGETLSGLIASETVAGVTLRRANQPDETIRRSQIKELRASGKSIMPDGFEQGLKAQDLADLMDFLRQPDVGLLPADP